MSEDVRKDVLGYVRRLIRYGNGDSDPELDDLTLGDIADRIIALVRSGS